MCQSAISVRRSSPRQCVTRSQSFRAKVVVGRETRARFRSQRPAVWAVRGAPDTMDMPPPPPRFDGSAAKADDGGARVMPPPPPLFSAPARGAETEIGQQPESSRGDAARPAPRSRAPPSGYEVPDWGGPSSADFSLEVLKDGAIVDVVDCRGRNFLTLGRTPENDVVLEHPSSSRLHAVLQFSGGTTEAFVYDPGSTHGTFVNKRKLKPNVHAPVFVGDQIKFGQSARIFVVSGASELMPEEGLSVDERRKLRALEKVSREEEMALLKFRQADARNRGGSASQTDWGMGEDDEETDLNVSALASLDWREHSGSFTEKQTTCVQKIRSKEEKMTRLRTESERISAKETEQNPLTQGQRTTLARNEAAIEKLEEEIGEADERLNESLRASLTGRDPKNVFSRGKKKTNVPVGSDSDDGSDDDFYDRTRSAADARRRRELRKKTCARRPSSETRDATEERKVGAAETVETAATLFEKRDVARAAMETLLSEEEIARAKLSSQAQKRESAKRDGAAEDACTTGEDALDAFMVSILATRDAEEADRLAQKIAEKRSELNRLDRLLLLADPRGEFAPGSDMQRTVAKLAEAERAKVLEEEERARRRAAAKANAAAEKAAADAERSRLREWESRGELVAKRTFAGGPGSTGGVLATAVETTGIARAPSSVDQATSSANARLPIGVSTAEDRRNAAAVSAAAVPGAAAARLPEDDDDGFLAPERFRDAAGKRVGSVLEIRASKKRRDDSRSEVSGTESDLVVSAAEARVAEDMRRLLGGVYRGAEDEVEREDELGTEFVAPEGQSGDGRTSLNDALGY